MALTIEQIQQNITDKRDLREVFNQLADYIQANPGGGDSGLLSATVELTDAQIKALQTTDIVVVAAPGANKMVQFISAALYLDWTADYTNISGDAGLVFGLGDDEANIEVSGMLEESPLGQVTALLAPGEDAIANINAAVSVGVASNSANKNLLIHLANDSDLTGGNAANTLKVTVYYVVVDL